MGLHLFRESKVMAVSFGGLIWRSDVVVRPNLVLFWSYLVLFWSDMVLFWSDMVLFSSCVHLSTTNVEHLDSITSLEVMKA
jgi:hypothetical protein